MALLTRRVVVFLYFQSDFRRPLSVTPLSLPLVPSCPRVLHHTRVRECRQDLPELCVFKSRPTPLLCDQCDSTKHRPQPRRAGTTFGNREDCRSSAEMPDQQHWRRGVDGSSYFPCSKWPALCGSKSCRVCWRTRRVLYDMSVRPVAQPQTLSPWFPEHELISCAYFREPVR